MSDGRTCPVIHVTSGSHCQRAPQLRPFPALHALAFSPHRVAPSVSLGTAQDGSPIRVGCSPLTRGGPCPCGLMFGADQPLIRYKASARQAALRSAALSWWPHVRAGCQSLSSAIFCPLVETVGRPLGQLPRPIIKRTPRAAPWRFPLDNGLGGRLGLGRQSLSPRASGRVAVVVSMALVWRD